MRKLFYALYKTTRCMSSPSTSPPPHTFALLLTRLRNSDKVHIASGYHLNPVILQPTSFTPTFVSRVTPNPFVPIGDYATQLALPPQYPLPLATSSAPKRHIITLVFIIVVNIIVRITQSVILAHRVYVRTTPPLSHIPLLAHIETRSWRPNDS